MTFGFRVLGPTCPSPYSPPASFSPPDPPPPDTAWPAEFQKRQTGRGGGGGIRAQSHSLRSGSRWPPPFPFHEALTFPIISKAGVARSNSSLSPAHPDSCGVLFQFLEWSECGVERVPPVRTMSWPSSAGFLEPDTGACSHLHPQDDTRTRLPIRCTVEYQSMGGCYPATESVLTSR